MACDANEIIVYEPDETIRLDVRLDGDTVWLTQSQMTDLFQRDRTVITRHINNVFSEGELDMKSNVHFLHIPNSDKPVKIYSLNVIISVGYRVKSIRGTQFRIWATNILREYLLRGHVVNTRLSQLEDKVDRRFAKHDTDIAELKEKVDFFFDTPVETIKIIAGGYGVKTKDGIHSCLKCIVSVGRSGSKWMEKICKELDIPTKSNRVDIGVRVELPAAVFAHLTDELYESKIVYRTEKYGDLVRTFCMNPKGAVVNENTNGIITVNGHSYEDPAKQTENTNFALLVAKHFSEPFKDSNAAAEHVGKSCNALAVTVAVLERYREVL